MKNNIKLKCLVAGNYVGYEPSQKIKQSKESLTYDNSYMELAKSQLSHNREQKTQNKFEELRSISTKASKR